MSLSRLIMLILFSFTTTIHCQENPNILGVNFILSDETKTDTVIGNIIQQTLAFPRERVLTTKHFVNIMAKSNLSIGDYLVVKPSGDLSTSQNIDKDTICLPLNCCSDLVCHLKFMVYFIPEETGSKVTVKVEVDIFDLNDSDPIFPMDSIYIEVEENFKEYRLNGPWKYSIPSAIDKDSADNGVIAYELIGNKISKSIFQLNTDDFDDLFLEFVKYSVLDYETEGMQLFSMQIKAKDGGIPPREGLLTINIKVIDLDDNKPEFIISFPSEFNIEEEKLLDQPLLTLKAGDKDLGVHGKLDYKLMNSSEPQAVKAFFLNSNTGQLLMREPLDFESLTHKQFNLTFFVSSGLENSLSDEISVRINVFDINDNKPTIPDSLILHLPEDTEPMHIVERINITDLDYVSMGKISCYLEEDFGATFDLQFISSNEFVTTFELLLLKSVDFESVNRLNLKLVCLDEALPQNRVSFKLPIDIIDVNDNQPIFKDFPTGSHQLFDIPEDFPVGNPIIQFSVYDPDLQQNTRINYHLETNETFLFPVKINKYKGILHLTHSLDYETRQEYSFKILVNDNEKPEKFLSNTLDVTLRVINVNDNKPRQVAPINGKIVISEVEILPRKITSLEFFDLDFNETFTMKFDPSDSPDNLKRVKKHFSIENQQLYLIENIDREVIPSIDVIVACFDSGNPPLKGTATFTIIISDVNDYSPVMVYPKNESTVKILTIPDAPKNFDYITKFVFEDLDLDNGSRVSAELMPGFNGSKYFQIGSDSTKKNSDSFYLMINDKSLVDNEIYQVGLEVTDHGVPRLTSHFVFYVETTQNSSQSVWLSDQEYEKKPGDDSSNSTSSRISPVKSFFSRSIVMQALIGGLVMIFSAALLTILVAIFIWTRERKKSPVERRPSELRKEEGSFRQAYPFASPLRPFQGTIDRTNIGDETTTFLNASNHEYNRNEYHDDQQNDGVIFDQMIPSELIDTGQSLIFISSNDLLMSSSINSNYPTVKSTTNHHFSTNNAYHLIDNVVNCFDNNTSAIVTSTSGIPLVHNIQFNTNSNHAQINPINNTMNQY